VSYQEPITVRQWGAGEILSLTLRENDDGDFEFASDAESVNADIILCREDAGQVAQWLLTSLEPIE
jgi:hypothetical protein